MVDPSSRLALGTAQLGMPYGVANATGQPDLATAVEIVRESWRQGIRFFDTAQAYGSSEEILGKAIRELGLGEQVRVITKLDPARDVADADAVGRSLSVSAARLGVKSLWGFLLHREELLDRWGGALESELMAARRRGLIEHLGVSVYSPEGARRALALDSMDILQVPASVFDRRANRSGLLDEAARLGKQVFIRSVFLQGLALMDEGSVPRRLGAAREAVSAFAGFCARARVERAKFALDYVRHLAPAGVAIVGAETPEQIRRNCAYASQPSIDPALFGEWDRLWPEDDLSFIDPSSWPR